MRKKFLGCIVGDAIGDAVGAPLEFWDRRRVSAHPRGSEWIDDMLPFVGLEKHPLGVWCDDPPRGTGTDDTRLNLVFAEAVAKYGTLINAKLLAAEHLDRYVNCRHHYPAHPDLAAMHFTITLPDACGVLGLPCPTRPGVPAPVLASGNDRMGQPDILGLLAMPSAGLLHPGDPVAAYEHAYELAYVDIGYAKDATGMLAAMIACGFHGRLSPREAIREGLSINPYRLGQGEYGHNRRMMAETAGRFLDLADCAQSDRELVLAISAEVQHLHPYDPIDVLGIVVAACYRADGEPRRAILMAVNDRDLDEAGRFQRFRDIDCTGSLCGALCGALAPEGIEAFPSDWITATTEANALVYGFDLAGSAQRMFETIVGEADP